MARDCNVEKELEPGKKIWLAGRGVGYICIFQFSFKSLYSNISNISQLSVHNKSHNLDCHLCWTRDLFYKDHIFNRPGVARDVLQSPMSLIDSLIHSFIK